jgi:hypothetical protein
MWFCRQRCRLRPLAANFCPLCFTLPFDSFSGDPSVPPRNEAGELGVLMRYKKEKQNPSTHAYGSGRGWFFNLCGAMKYFRCITKHIFGASPRWFLL